MPYIEYLPHPALSPYIQCFWHYQSDESSDNPDIIIPDNCSDILIDLSQQGKISSLFTGTMTRPIFSSRKELIGIRFKPGYAYAFFGIPMKEFADIIVELNDFWEDTDLLEQGIYSQDNIFQRINYLQNMLISHQNKFLPIHVSLSDALQSISSNTEFNSVDNLSSETGVSRQHLRRIFLDYVGINPVQYMRISRIRKTIKHIRKEKKTFDMSFIAQDFGYYDQSHMILDFRKFTGSTPNKFFSQK
ncbi:MAG: AraC family transcriptional regulator [Acidobacteria bacterium]|nr:AraC family transcriptional regulator [Acidobacteriota bacterium]